MKIYWRGAWLGYAVLLTLPLSFLSVTTKHGHQLHPFALLAVPLLMLWVVRGIFRGLVRFVVAAANPRPKSRPLHAPARKVRG